MVSGRPSVRHPEGTDVLEPDDVVFFAPGPEGAHQVRNTARSPPGCSCGPKSRSPP